MSRKSADRKPVSRPKPLGRQTIAVCVIAKNEERFIADCLESARPYVDELVVVDTGSTDRTREIAREHGARVEYFEWCDDFAAARNAAIEHATADWIFMLDADEQLDPASGPQLRGVVAAVPPGTHSIAPIIESRQLDDMSAASTTLNVPRLFPRRPDVRFVGAIHEIVTYLPDPSHTTLASAPQLRIIHYGYDVTVYKGRDKDARNIALLEKVVEQDPDDARMLYFLIQQHYTGGRPAETVRFFDRFVEASVRLPKAFLVEGYGIYFSALIDLNEAQRLEEEVVRARELDALGANALDFLANHYIQRREYVQAEACLRELIDAEHPRGITIGEGLGGWASHLKLAELADRTGRVDMALAELELGFAALPALKRSLVAQQATAFALRHNRLDSAAQWLERARTQGVTDPESRESVLHLSVDLALARADLQSAFDTARQLSPQTGEGIQRLHTVATRLRAVGEREAALIVLNRAVDGPARQDIYWLLVQTLTELGRFDDASLALAALEQFQLSQKLVA